LAATFFSRFLAEAALGVFRWTKLMSLAGIVSVDGVGHSAEALLNLARLSCLACSTVLSRHLDLAPTNSHNAKSKPILIFWGWKGDRKTIRAKSSDCEENFAGEERWR
jgi:hypothetical protein